MVNLKKYTGFLKLFVIILTLFLLVSCSKQAYFVSKIEGKRLTITANESQNQQIETYIKPYRERINKDLDSVLAYCPETLDKSEGKWQTTIGNLLADVTFLRGNLVFKTRYQKEINVCILNHGGIRAILPKGNVTSRTAFEIMPFENGLVVIALNGKQIFEMVDYFIATQKPHPLSGITFIIGKDKLAKEILVQGKPVSTDAIYYVATNEYLSNGGDNMNFFKKGINKYDLDYKLRNLLIDYFKETDTIPVISDTRISIE